MGKYLTKMVVQNSKEARSPKHRIFSPIKRISIECLGGASLDDLKDKPSYGHTRSFHGHIARFKTSLEIAHRRSASPIKLFEPNYKDAIPLFKNASMFVLRQG